MFMLVMTKNGKDTYIRLDHYNYDSIKEHIYSRANGNVFMTNYLQDIIPEDVETVKLLQIVHVYENSFAKFEVDRTSDVTSLIVQWNENLGCN